MSNSLKTQVVVIGAGPAGYSAAFRAADLGLDVIIVEKYSTLGGVCLNVGCIPSKALLHISKVVREVETISSHGVNFSKPTFDIDKIRSYKEGVISKLTNGLAGMAKGRKVQHIIGIAKFKDKHNLIVDNNGNITEIYFENAIIAAGSTPTKLPFIPNNDPRIWDSTDALRLKEIPKKLLVIGGGIIGLEMATVYSSLGSDVHVVEPGDRVIRAADKDITDIYESRATKQFNIIHNTGVKAVEAKEDAIYVTYSGNKENQIESFDAILVAVGRQPNGKKLDAEKAGVNIDERGFIKTNKQMRTNVDNIFAIGDIVGQPMLAHKGVHEGHVAAEVIAGKIHYFDPKVIPSIAYTDPEVAWVGKTELECKEEGLNYEVASFPWAASGRAIASDTEFGKTKLIINKDNNTILGGACVGTNAGELLGEITLAIELGVDAEDIALTIHAHPTLHETVGLAAEVYEGTVTDYINPKAKKK